MQSTFIIELLKLFFSNCSNNPRDFVANFDQSTHIIGYNYRCTERRFTHISVSFKHILGYSEQNILNNGKFMSKIVHPQDQEVISECLKRSLYSNNASNQQADLHKLTQVKCRAKHMHGYWKYFILFAQDYWNEIEKSYDKFGVIVVESIRTGPGNEKKYKADCDQTAMNGFNPEAKGKNSDGASGNISPREKEILEMISNGLVTKEIASQLHISENTVITHRKNLITKLNVRNTAELIKKATRHMLI